MWIVVVIIVGVIYLAFTDGSHVSVKESVSTQEGYPKAEVSVIQCNNVPQGASALVVCNHDNIVIRASGYEKFIPHGDIIDITLESANHHIKEDTQFSMGRAAAGVALLGGIGAIAGMSGKNKSDLKMLIIAYIDDGETIYMSFLQRFNGGKPVKVEANLLTIAHIQMLNVIK